MLAAIPHRWVCPAAAPIEGPSGRTTMDFAGETLSHFLLGRQDPWLAALALLVGILTVYVALDLGKRVLAARGEARLAWMAGGAVAMGGGIWSTHAIGLLSLRLPAGSAYDLRLTLLSLPIA